MAPNSLEEQITKYLTDVHSIERFQPDTPRKLEKPLAAKAQIMEAPR